MVFFKKTQSKLKRLKRDESGSMAVAWALSIGVMAIVIGAALDLAVLQNADARSQSLADTTALAAAVFIRNHERPPNDREEGLIGDYTADELGYDFSSRVEGGASGIDITVAYDDVEREATVTVTGNTRPTVLQIVGADTGFHSKSIVKYKEVSPTDPASVVLVLDNSGSMNFADRLVDSNDNAVPGTESRIDGLKSSANGFMTFLDEKVGPQDENGEKDAVLRTGMLAFSREIITERTVDMHWGTIDEGDINDMEPGGATNSAPPLEDAERWLNVDEPPIHRTENGSTAPLKYLILMTDGKNTVGDDEWAPREGTQTWRQYVTGRSSPNGLSGEEEDSPPLATTTVIEPERTETRGTGRFDAECHYINSGNLFGRFFGLSWDPAGIRLNGTIFCVTEEQMETVTIPAVTGTTYSGFEYYVGIIPPAGAWEEGEFDIESNINTRAQCDILEDRGVEIFTIAYALAPGRYARTQFSNGTWSNFGRSTITPAASADARGLLQYCATSPENFITADNADALNAAFERIGETIVKEVIRISG